MNITLNNSNRRHQLSISVLNDIDTYNGKQGHKLDNWLANIENAATLVEENEVMIAKGKARGLARDLIKEHEDKPWPHIKEQLCNRLNNASIHTYTSRFMEIQQKDSETLTVYIHRFKKEAKYCDFNSHPAEIRIFPKGLINTSKIAPGVYEKGPNTTENAISIVEKISSAQHIATSFSQNHQISMMKRGSTDHHTPNQNCSNCRQLGHPWFTCPCIVCHGCNQYSHILRHCWDRIPPSGTVSPPEGWHNNGKRLSCPQYLGNGRDDRRSRSNIRPRPRDRSGSHSRHPSTDRHASRDRNPRRRHTPNSNRAQSQSPHRQRSGSNRPPTPYPRNSSRSRSSSCYYLQGAVKPDSFTPPKYQLDSTIQQQLDNLLGTFKDQFAKDEMTIGITPLTQMSINTRDSDPVSQKPYPVAMKHYNWVKEEIDK